MGQKVEQGIGHGASQFCEQSKPWAKANQSKATLKVSEVKRSQSFLATQKANHPNGQKAKQIDGASSFGKTGAAS